MKIFVQSDFDKDYILSKGFKNVEILSFDGTKYKNITLYKTSGQHGKREVIKPLCEQTNIPYDIMGVVFKSETEKTLYVAGDTIYCEEVESALNKYTPEVVVVNACAATVLNGERLIMNIEDVRNVLKTAPYSTVVASHMDAISHLSITRADLKEYVDKNNVDNLLIPEDGETLYFPTQKEIQQNKITARKFYE